MALVFLPVETLLTRTTSFTSPSAIQITLPASVIAMLNTALGIVSFTTIAVSDGINTEFMYLNGITAGAANVTRGVDGSVAVPLASGATVRFVWLVAGISAIAGSPTTTTLTGTGAAAVTGGPAYNVNVPVTAITAGTGISVAGAFPSFTITNSAPLGPPGPPGPAGPSTIVTASGIALSTPILGGFNINVDDPVFIAGPGIAITGTWPTITIANIAVSGGTGTVTSVTAGPGIAVTGTPTVVPIVSLTTTGIVAGTYGGITVDIYGRISAISTGFVTSIVSTTPALVVSTPSPGTIGLNIANGNTGAAGILQLAASTSAASNNAGDSTSAVSPAGIAAVVASLSTTGGAIVGSGFQSALSAASYTTNVPALTTIVSIPAGKTLSFDLYIEVYDTAAPTVPSSFAVGLFNGASLLTGNSQIPSSSRNLKYVISGPLSATITVNTTTLGGTETLGSYFMTTTNN